MKSTVNLAAIDIGSNAIRLLIHSVEASASGLQSRKMAYLRVPIRLGEDVFTSGVIGPDKSEKLLAAMQAFSCLFAAYSVDRHRACATSAMRDATNCREVVSQIAASTGINIEIINGRVEADLVYEAGSLHSLITGQGASLYVDVGGGSTEVIVYSQGGKQFTHSFQIGTVRLLAGAVAPEEEAKFRDILEEIHRRYRPENIIATGGNINKVHKLLGKKKSEPVSGGELTRLYETMNGMSVDVRRAVYDLNAYRADVIVPALWIFTSIIRFCPSAARVHVPKVGLADGLIHNMQTQLFG